MRCISSTYWNLICFRLVFQTPSSGLATLRGRLLRDTSYLTLRTTKEGERILSTPAYTLWHFVQVLLASTVWCLSLPHISFIITSESRPRLRVDLRLVAKLTDRILNDPVTLNSLNYLFSPPPPVSYGRGWGWLKRLASDTDHIFIWCRGEKRVDHTSYCAASPYTALRN